MSTFNLPDLGEGLAEAEILAWHVKPGDRVLADQPMLTVETAKAVVEVPVPFGGTVTALRAAVGEVVATGSPLIDFDSGTVVGTMPPAGGEELFDGGAVAAPPRDAGRMRALPAARALARHLGLALESIPAGADGIVGLDDVLALRPGAAPRAVPPLAVPPGAAAEPLRGARRSMAHSMSLSRTEVAHSTVCDDADIHSWSRRGDYMPRLIRAIIAGCRAEPALNAWYDSSANARVLMERIDLGIAIDTVQGLLVPVLRDVASHASADFGAAVAALKEAANRRSLAPEDLRGATFVLSNFGTLAGRYGTPLVVPPAVAILGAGAVRDDAVVVDGALAAHRRMPLSLSFDHRCVTGGEACRYLAAVIADLEKPD